MEKYIELPTELRVAALAAYVLPLVLHDNGKVYAASIARQLKSQLERYPHYLENDVGAALRYLHKSGLVTSTPDTNPRYYSLTQLGAFTISLQDRKQPPTLSLVS